MAGVYEYEMDGEKRMFMVVGRKPNVGLSRGLVNIHRREDGTGTWSWQPG